MIVWSRYRLPTLFFIVGILAAALCVGLRIIELNRRSNLIARCFGTFVLRLSDSWLADYEPHAQTTSRSHVWFPAHLIYPVVEGTFQDLEDSELKEFGAFSSMERLYVSGPSVSDAGLVGLSEMRMLEELRLHNTLIDGSGFVHLRNCDALRLLALNLGEVSLVPRAFEHLSGLASLERLELYHVDDNSLGRIGCLQRLREFTLHGASETPLEMGRSLEEIQQLHNLEELRLTHVRISEVLILSMAQMPNLHTLRVSDSTLEPADSALLDTRLDVPTLRSIVFTGTAVPSETLRRMSTAMRECEILYRIGEYPPWQEELYVDGAKTASASVGTYGRPTEPVGAVNEDQGQ